MPGALARAGRVTVAGGKGFRVSLDQKRARWFGVLYLITFVTSIPALLLYEPALRHPVAFVAGSGNVNKIYLGALLELLLIIANIGTAVVIVPIMRRQFEELSIGYVTARIFECTFILVGIVAMLGIATLQQESAGAAEGTVAYTLAAIKDWTFTLGGGGWVVGWGNGLILGYMMYRTGLVPRRVAWLGLVGGPLLIATGTAIMFSGNHPSSTLRSLQGIATIPEVPVGTLPRRLLHHLGFQARCPDPPSRGSRSRGDDARRRTRLGQSIWGRRHLRRLPRSFHRVLSCNQRLGQCSHRVDVALWKRAWFTWRLAGITMVMPWIVKGLFILAKTRRGRKLLFAAGLAAIELAQGDRARKLYAKARASVNDQAVKQTVTRSARRVAQAIRP